MEKSLIKILSFAMNSFYKKIKRKYSTQHLVFFAKDHLFLKPCLYPYKTESSVISELSIVFPACSCHKFEVNVDKHYYIFKDISNISYSSLAIRIVKIDNGLRT